MRWILLAVLFISGTHLFAYDTLRLSLEDAEVRFLKNNLMLLAEQYQVESQTALIVQARLWANPRFSAELNAYNPQRDEYFDIGNQGQKAFAIEQLIYLGGKRKNQIALARQNADLASLELEDLLRNLKLQLRASYYSVYYDEQTLNRYTHQLQLLSSIISAYQIQSEKGNIPLKEVLRLKAVYYQLNNDKTELINSILDEEKTLKLLLREEGFIQPTPIAGFFEKYTQGVLLESELTSQALTSRPDYRISQGEVQYAELNYRLQRSLAVPDVTLGGSYDQRGGAFVNQVGVTLGVDLPVLNRNQGNIKSSQYTVQRIMLERDNKKLEISAEVQASLQKLIRVEEEYSSVDQSFTRDFELLNDGVIKNFQKRNVSLLEFVDFFESYNESLQALNKLKKARLQSYEELNNTVGTELFK